MQTLVALKAHILPSLWAHLFQSILLFSFSWASRMPQYTELIQDRTAATTVCTEPPTAAQKVTTSPGKAASAAPEPLVLSFIKALRADKNQPSSGVASNYKDL